jgi:hypothetical protein
MYQEVKQMIKQIVGNDPLMFTDPIRVKRSPHTLSVNIYGCVVDDADQLRVNCSGDWHLVEDNITDTLIINSLYQRVAFIHNQKKTA